MPELPEVETLRRRLAEVLPGKTFAQIEVHHPKSFAGEMSQLVGQSILAVNRRAKILDFELTNGLHVLTHLKMTGQLIVLSNGNRLGGGHPTADWVQELPSKHTRISYTFDDDTRMFFNDQRIFGWMRVMDQEALAEAFLKLGPDITDPLLNVEYLTKMFSRRSTPIKQVIMDSAVVAGIGNIYACDALNLAKISPFRLAKSLSEDEVSTLLDSCRQVINRGIELGGTTFDGKYVDIDGFAGRYQHELLVYGQEGKPCPNCGGVIEKVQLGGRGTYWCPQCQL